MEIRGYCFVFVYLSSYFFYSFLFFLFLVDVLSVSVMVSVILWSFSATKYHCYVTHFYWQMAFYLKSGETTAHHLSLPALLWRTLEIKVSRQLENKMSLTRLSVLSHSWRYRPQTTVGTLSRDHKYSGLMSLTKMTTVPSSKNHGTLERCWRDPLQVGDCWGTELGSKWV